jgi:hypothetical protein
MRLDVFRFIDSKWSDGVVKMFYSNYAAYQVSSGLAQLLDLDSR